VVRHPQGQVFFVPGSWPGDEAEFEVVSVKDRYGRARISKLHTPSAERRESPCQHFGFEPGKCGGCQWIFATYASQLKYKEARILRALERAKLVDQDFNFLPILGAPDEWAYRNRAQFKTDGNQIGFVSFESKTIAPVDECKILNGRMSEIFSELKASLPRTDWAPTESFIWNFLDLNESTDIKTFSINKRAAFQQGNSSQNEQMKTWLKLKLSELEKTQSVLELYCGSGNFTDIIAAEKFAHIWAAESDRPAVGHLQNKKLSHVQVMKMDLFNPAALRVLSREASRAQILVLDPPREGARNVQILLQGLKYLQHALYISCDVATFVRDAVILRSAGLRLKELQPIDLFPQTPHVEILAKFVKI